MQDLCHQPYVSPVELAVKTPGLLFRVFGFSFELGSGEKTGIGGTGGFFKGPGLGFRV